MRGVYVTLLHEIRLITNNFLSVSLESHSCQSVLTPRTMKFEEIISLVISLLYMRSTDVIAAESDINDLPYPISPIYRCRLETNEYFHFNTTMTLTKCVFYGIKRHWWQSEYELVSPMMRTDTRVIDMGGSKFNNRSQLATLTNRLCVTFNEVEYLFVDYLELNSIDSGAFDSCERLQYLDLDGNNLIMLPHELFQWNPDLSKVSLAGNKLVTFDFVKIFAQSNNLAYLSLFDNKLIEITPTTSLPNLTELNLAKNFLRDIDFKRILTNFTALENIRLCNNNLSIWLQKKIRDVCHAKGIYTDLEFCLSQYLPESNLGNVVRVIHEVFG